MVTHLPLDGYLPSPRWSATIPRMVTHNIQESHPPKDGHQPSHGSSIHRIVTTIHILKPLTQQNWSSTLVKSSLSNILVPFKGSRLWVVKLLLQQNFNRIFFWPFLAANFDFFLTFWAFLLNIQTLFSISKIHLALCNSKTTSHIIPIFCETFFLTHP